MVRKTWYLLGTGNSRINGLFNRKKGAITVAETLPFGYFLLTRNAEHEAEFPPLLQDNGWRQPEEVLYTRMVARRQTCSFVESCTGGLCAEKITKISGSSSVFWGGWVVYSNAAKEQLGIPKSLLLQYGAVSRQTVACLAELGRKRAGTEHCAALSGVAGPSGGTPEKPVGTVWIGVASAGDKVKAYRFLFRGSRTEIREKAAAAACLILGR